MYKRMIYMKSSIVLLCLICSGLFLASCVGEEMEERFSNDTEKVVFMVMNRTGHNGPASMVCGGEAETVEFTFVTPAEKLIQLITGDTQVLVGLEIQEGQRITVIVKDPVSKEELVSKSTLFNPVENNLPEGANPLVRLCPKTSLEFKYF